MSTEDITPIRLQYLEIKRQHPDSILFFRLGDFYETFDQDAETVSRELDIVLTSRPIGKGMRAPLAGIPYHAVENYLSRLIEKGYHVAICEQIGEQPIKGIFPRQVVRVVTPGTLVEPGLLPSDANNYLTALVIDGDRAGIAYVDITTGEFAVTELPCGKDLSGPRAELTRLRPAEIIHPDNVSAPAGVPGQMTPWKAWRFELAKNRAVLLSHFGVLSLDGLGLSGKEIAVRSAGAILQYLKETEPGALSLLNELRVYSFDEFMTLDASTRRNLELTETLRGETRNSLLGVLDQTITPMGKRLIRHWVSQPLLDPTEIGLRLDGVEYFLQRSMLRLEFRTALKPLRDLERLINRLVLGHALPRDLASLQETLAALPAVKGTLLRKGLSTAEAADSDFLPNFDVNEVSLDLIQRSIAEDAPQTLQNIGVIRPGFSAELDDVIEASRHAREWINSLEPLERTRTGIKTLKVGFNKVFGYYLEVSSGQTGNVPPEYIRKQTLVNAERYITPDLKEYETLVLNAEGRIHEIEQRLFKEICLQLAAHSGNLLQTSRALAHLDVLSALAEIASQRGYIRPSILEDNTLEIQGGRHPVVETSLTEDRYVPNDLIFGQGEIVRLITGPNMSGKSTYLRQAALIILMAQIGSFVPASSATIGLVDRIFTRIGAQDEIHAGQSTFMVEMIEAANILHHATSRSLLILDEIGRGTSTYDGVSIAWAMIEYIHNHPQLRAKTLFATHYHELTQLADLLPGIRNYNVAVSEADGNVVFLHKIIPGGADRSYGIHVAQLAGMPRTVIQRASEIMAELEKSSGRAVRIDPHVVQQVALFPETNPLLDELKGLDTNVLSPIDALNKLFEWQKKFLPPE